MSTNASTLTFSIVLAMYFQIIPYARRGGTPMIAGDTETVANATGINHRIYPERGFDAGLFFSTIRDYASTLIEGISEITRE